jgi:hypothetical protein
MQQPKQSEFHAGVLKSREYEADEFFEFGGQKLLLKGTSGPPKERSRIAEGRPIRHDVMIAGQTIPARGTSGAGQLESRVAVGRHVQHSPGPRASEPEVKGSGQLIGGPIRRV